MTPEEAFGRADVIGAGTCYRIRLTRESFEAGRQSASAEMAQQSARAARTVTEPVPERRPGPGGRAHFAGRRPGGFPGRGAQPQAEHELEVCT